MYFLHCISIQNTQKSIFQNLEEIETNEAQTWALRLIFDAEQEYINEHLLFSRFLL